MTTSDNDVHQNNEDIITESSAQDCAASEDFKKHYQIAIDSNNHSSLILGWHKRLISLLIDALNISIFRVHNSYCTLHILK